MPQTLTNWGIHESSFVIQLLKAIVFNFYYVLDNCVPPNYLYVILGIHLSLFCSLNLKRSFVLVYS
jgi:hypothetical protein